MADAKSSGGSSRAVAAGQLSAAAQEKAHDIVCSPRARLLQAKEADAEAAAYLDGRAGTPLPLVEEGGADEDLLRSECKEQTGDGPEPESKSSDQLTAVSFSFVDQVIKTAQFLSSPVGDSERK